MINLFHLASLFFLFVAYPYLKSPVVPGEEVDTVKYVHPDDDDYIPWKYERKLTWEDFLSNPVKNTDAVASTSTALGLSYKLSNNAFLYDINCSFSKNRSWGLLKTTYILAHEQGHFDITEIYARKLHQELSAYTVNPKTFKQDVNRIYEKVVREKEAFQEQYDHLTDHSRKKVKQEEWLDKIDQMLVETEPYSNYP